ncbi:EAL domain-containing response regulator [Leptospira ilyithenensis]|uniref:EAL domain-containing protein n=1 Tax=Leptospira ilyithenensis TaxID=2484901 RepID=A0A4R9LP35_9LEPT|nr:EAL domain-containing response regulator [Leptospira ilyithenensis]TGN10608.1 EAL domain-containing protein [Leptospira ilyithenensis]
MSANDLGFLVVEDDDFQRQVIVDILRKLGITRISEAIGGVQALQVLGGSNANPVDIVLCDLNMPEMDGMEFLRHLGNSHSSISTIIMSALDGALIASVKKMARAYGIILLGAMEKPITPAKLEVMISLYRNNQSGQKREFPAERTFTLEEILQGIKDKQFEPFFQPKVDIATGEITGAEALARWVHPKHGVIAPYAFIEILEESGNIDELTFVMLEKAATACRLLHDKGHKITVSVNLSLVSLADVSLADRITHLVIKSGIEPRQMILEITETAAMTEMAPALENLARLRMKGFGLSIDDYGTGYSSMQQITRIAFTELKIDRSFVRDITESRVLRIVVNSSIKMATKLQMKSIAEGVETKQDWDTLKLLSCDTAQGYYIAKPMNLSSLIEYLEKITSVK